MAVVVQELVDADVAGVPFTRNPVSGAAERVIEASWGLGEAVVAGMVIPDLVPASTPPAGCSSVGSARRTWPCGAVR